MNCSGCGVELSSEAKFCHKCGESVRSELNSPRPASEAEIFTADSSAQENSSIDRTAEKTPSEKFKDSLRPRTDSEPELERDLWQGGYSGKAMLGHWLFAGGATLALLAGGGFLAGSGVAWLVIVAIILLVWFGVAALLGYRKLSYHYELTTQRFVHREGILRRTTDRIEVIDIDDVTFQQGIVERLLGIGSIRITSSDTSHPELWMRGIANVRRVADSIDDVRRQERRKRGVHIESI